MADEEKTKKPLIYKKINDIMGELGHIAKSSKNETQHFMFRGIDQVMNEMKPLLSKHGVNMIPEVINTHREERATAKGANLIYSVLTIKYHFVATDGSEVTATVVGEGMDMADKASNKAMAVAFKYACFQVFCIPTEEMTKDDPDRYSFDGSMNAEVADMLRKLEKANTIDEMKMLWEDCTPAMQQDKILRNAFTERKLMLTNK